MVARFPLESDPLVAVLDAATHYLRPVWNVHRVSKVPSELVSSNPRYFLP